MLMVTKRARMGIYIVEFLSIKSQGGLITWFCKSCEILGLLYLNYHKAHDYQSWQGGDFLLESSTLKITQLFEHVGSRGKLKTLYIHYHNLYDH